MIRRPPRSTLFPYTRSSDLPAQSAAHSPIPPARRPGPWHSPASPTGGGQSRRSEEHTSELQSQSNLVCRLLLEKKKRPIFTCCHSTMVQGRPSNSRVRHFIS